MVAYGWNYVWLKIMNNTQRNSCNYMSSVLYKETVKPQDPCVRRATWKAICSWQMLGKMLLQPEMPKPNLFIWTSPEAWVQKWIKTDSACWKHMYFGTKSGPNHPHLQNEIKIGTLCRAAVPPRHAMNTTAGCCIAPLFPSQPSPTSGCIFQPIHFEPERMKTYLLHT